MNSRVPNASADAAGGIARPAGMSLGQWLNSRIAPAPVEAPQAPVTAAAAAHSLSEIHQRLDGITQQIDQMSQRRAAGTTSGLASQLNDAIARLDSRLSNLAQPAHAPQPPMPAYEAHGAAAYHTSPPLSPLGLDAAIAEISARRHSLNDGGAYAAAPNPFMQQAPTLAPAAPPVDLSGIERQLHNLTSQMEALRRPDHLDQSIAAFREELAEIRRSLTEALPRQAIDSLENEIRTLGQKLEQSRESGGDQETLGGIERALNEIYGTVRALTPAEQLTGYDSAIQNLSGKIDLLVRANPDSNIVQQLEDAIAALRNIAANVASNDAVAHLSEHIQALGVKLDQHAQVGGNEMLAALEQRIALLTTAMEGRQAAAAPAMAVDSTQLEHAILALSERIDRLSAGNDQSSAMAHVEQRIAYLIERLEGAQASSWGNFGRIEENLSDIMRQLEQQRTNFAGNGGNSQPADTSGIVDAFKRELSDVRHTQSETERRTQDTLEALHSTLSHAVERLASIEGDLHRMQSAPEPVAAPPRAPAFAQPAYSPPPVVQPELPNPVVPQMSDVRLPLAAPPAVSFRDEPQPPPAPVWQQTQQRTPIDPNLPPDTPLEPGARNRADSFGPTDLATDVDAAPPAEGGQSNFIAAARRAAQAAAAAAQDKPSRVSALTEAARNAAAKATAKVAAAGDTAAKPSRIRQILVGFSVVMIVIGAFKIALTFMDGSDSAPPPVIDKSAAPTSIAPPPPVAPVPSPKAEAPAVAPAPAPTPILTSPTAIQRQSFVAPANAVAGDTARTADITGSIAQPVAAPASPPAVSAPADVAALSPVNDKIPDALAGPLLRAAAMRGEPAAAYEVAARYAEGRGVPVNYEEALKWYERAADKGIVLAMFRLGTLMEKGLGTKKDPDAARRYYLQAAERGNAKAMHNLAVLDADGGGKGPNYKGASTWFKKAAERGVADSQYNVGSPGTELEFAL